MGRVFNFLKFCLGTVCCILGAFSDTTRTVVPNSLHSQPRGQVLDCGEGHFPPGPSLAASLHYSEASQLDLRVPLRNGEGRPEWKRQEGLGGKGKRRGSEEWRKAGARLFPLQELLRAPVCFILCLLLISEAVVGNTWTAGYRVNKSSSEFVWKLVTANSYTELPVNFDQWKSGEPSNLVPVQHCLQLNRDYNFAWDDFYCQYQRSSVCEVDLAWNVLAFNILL